MMIERNIKVDHSTLNRWVIAYSEKFSKNLRKHRNKKYDRVWYVDETYIKVKGKWSYLYRAINKQGHTIDFYLSTHRNKQAARHFLKNSLEKILPTQRPKVINTDKDSAYPGAIASLVDDRKLPQEIIDRRVKYLNNRIESDHGKLKRLIKPTLGFKACIQLVPRSPDLNL